MSSTPKALIMGFGTFDGLHPGHLFYIGELRKQAKKLIIVIARDQNVKRFKGRLPYFNENTRMENVKKLDLADEVVLGSLEDFYEVIRTYQPNVLGFGYDQNVDEKKLKTIFPEVEILRIDSYYPEKYKSSLLKKSNSEA